MEAQYSGFSLKKKKIFVQNQMGKWIYKLAVWFTPEISNVTYFISPMVRVEGFPPEPPVSCPV